MISGCPVIISDQTPWKNLYEITEDKNYHVVAGRDLKLNIELFTNILLHCLYMKNDEYLKLAQSTINFAEKIINDEGVLAANKSLFIEN